MNCSASNHHQLMLWPTASRPPCASHEPANCFTWPMQPCALLLVAAWELWKLSSSAFASTSNAPMTPAGSAPLPTSATPPVHLPCFQSCKSNLTDMLCCRWEGASEQLCSAERLWAHVSLHQCAQELAELINLSGLTCVYCCRWQEPNEQFCRSECVWSHIRVHQCP